MKFDINHQTPEEILLEILDEDVGEDDSLGKTSICLTEIVNNKKLLNKWIK
jgi:hypothetical protein